MTPTSENKFITILREHQQEILADWIREQTAPGVIRPGLMRDADIRGQCEEFLKLLAEAARKQPFDLAAPELARVTEFLSRLSRARGEQGFTPSETAVFLLSLKRPIFTRLRKQLEHDGPALADEIWAVTELLDRLALYTTETFQKGREEVILRQQQDMLELSTPVVKLWEGVLALPLIGTLDSNRTQVVMETLLQRIVETGSEVAIIDITGVPTVDTLVAQHLMKTVAAAKLMGVECIISGIRPQIAQTIVHLAVDLGDVTTKASLAEAFRIALKRTGASIQRDAALVAAAHAAQA
jgi:rsbT co-antagonist protein RsbR